MFTEQQFTDLVNKHINTVFRVWDYEHVVDEVTITSFVLRPLSAVIYYECEDGANFTDHKEMRMFVVMKDGSQVELEDHGSGGIGFAVLTANAPIIIENVDYILLADGMKINLS